MQRLLFLPCVVALALAASTLAVAAEFSLYDAAKGGDVEQVRRLLAEGAEVNLPDPLDTPLHAAAAAGRLEVTELLIAAGANIEIHGFLGTPLHNAAVGGRLEVVELLIAKGADVDAVNAYGSTPLHLAAEHGHAGLRRWWGRCTRVTWTLCGCLSTRAPMSVSWT
jgi:ankyrin repeat protein